MIEIIEYSPWVIFLQFFMRFYHLYDYVVHRQTTAIAPASKVEAVVRSPTNMATAKIAAVDFNKMTSK